MKFATGLPISLAKGGSRLGPSDATRLESFKALIVFKNLPPRKVSKNAVAP